ncbi:hypothetical protein [Streptomyces sp. NBC_00687]|uniref:hypothetical protein n=1 Tax=Streptomyces sp. NBC_00687 TaxID=2975807 RepID=UPI00224D3B60|nr:hypothetical protein [Streptomyces sp. NBC_00687]MCX4912880.1 hypothetical protein [Streptomyces sp. NBC_00687]
MTQRRVRKQKAVRRREADQAGESDTADRERGERASRRAQGVTEAARRFLSRMPRP